MVFFVDFCIFRFIFVCFCCIFCNFLKNFYSFILFILNILSFYIVLKNVKMRKKTCVFKIVLYFCCMKVQGMNGTAQAVLFLKYY